MALKVLIAEDNDDARELLGQLLRIYGYNPVLASDGLEALQSITKECPDVAILDISMPNMDGYTLCHRIKESCGDSVYLIAMTGHAGSDEEEAIMRAGFNVRLVKPIGIDRLKGLLAQQSANTS